MSPTKKSYQAIATEQSLLFMPDTEQKTSFFLPGIGAELTAGIDEAGRGCLAGPVVAAAVMLPAHVQIEGLDDSKKIPETRRIGLAAQIGATACAWGLGVVWAQEIDRINILQATLKAMALAVQNLKIWPRALLIDGNHTIPKHLLQPAQKSLLEPKQRAIIKGDARVPVIAAASIVAKTFRDHLMERLDRRYPVYGFAKHKGYGTQEHLEALRLHGPCRLHRLTFAGVLPEQEKEETLKQARLW